MTKENLMFGVIGLMIGAIIGFMFANSVNKGALPQPASTTATAAGPLGGDNPALPADHPPIGTTGGQTQSGGPLPQVTAAIEKANKEPQNYEAQMTAADLYYQIQRFDDAAKFYEAAVKLKPTDSEPMIKAGNAYFDAAQTAAENNDSEAATPKFVLAEKWYLLALEKEPKNINVRTDLGLTFFLREPKNVDRALKEYERSLAIDPNHEVTLQNMALAYKEKGDSSNLQKATARLKSINPNNPALSSLEGK